MVKENSKTPEFEGSWGRPSIKLGLERSWGQIMSSLVGHDMSLDFILCDRTPLEFYAGKK